MKKFVLVFMVVAMAVCCLGFWSHAELATIKSERVAVGVDPELDIETDKKFDSSTTSLLIYNRETRELMYSFNGLLLHHEVLTSSQVRSVIGLREGSYVGAVRDGFEIVGKDFNDKDVIEISTILSKCMPTAFIVVVY